MSRVLLAALLVAPSARAAAPPEPLPSRIAGWIDQLGDDEFLARQRAARLLRAAGERAEAALEVAARSTDPEVRRLTKPILADFQAGIYPDTPEKVVGLINQYRAVAGSEKPPILHGLLSAGPAGTRAVLKLARNERDPIVRKDAFAAIGQTVGRSAGKLLDDGNGAVLESLLELAVEGDLKTGGSHLAAYHLLLGTLPGKIAEYQKRAKDNPPGKAPNEVLVYLHRAAGDLDAAKKAAADAERNDLLEGLLFESSDWKELDRRTDFASHPQWVVAKGYRAAYARLAGNKKAADQALAEIVEKAKPVARDKGDVLLHAKALFFNGRANEALELMATAGTERRLLFECYVAQMRYKEAFALADYAEANDRPERWTLRVLEARARHALGQKAAARKLLDKAAEFKAGTASLPHLPDLIEAEAAVESRDAAFGLFARYYAATKDDTHTMAAFKALLRDHADEAMVVWYTLRGDDFKGTPADKLALVRRLFEGAATADEVTELLKTVRGRPAHGTGAEVRMKALGEACVRCKLDRLAVGCFAEAGVRGSVRVGDLMRDAKQPARAAEAYLAAYKQASESDVPGEERDGEALPSLALFLAGQALLDQGRAAEAKDRTDRAHLLLLGDVRRRMAFQRALQDRGFADASRREAGLMARLGEPVPTDDDNYYTMEGVRVLAIAAERAGESAKAADRFEQVFLGCMQPGINFTKTPAYVTVPGHLMHLRAVGLAKAGRLDEAREVASAALACWPANLDVTIGLVPALEKGGKKEDAAALYRATLEVQAAALKGFPDSPLLLNQMAWLAGCCKRDLDRAAGWARRAVDSSPKTPAYLDTLAEVLFQQGKKAEAAAAQKKAVALDPKRRYFKAQLKRIEAGDASAPLPAED
ncbi:MAG: hypothetical protein ACRC33_07675 [Gemmataceae bacterium]